MTYQVLKIGKRGKMGKLDIILKDVLLEGPLTVSADYTTDYADVSGLEESGSIQLVWSDGASTPDITYYLEVSNDATNWVRITESAANEVEASGTGIWDIALLGVTFLRVAIVVNSGQVDIQSIIVSAKRRH